MMHEAGPQTWRMKEREREREILLRLRATRKMHFAQGGPPGFTSENETRSAKNQTAIADGPHCSRAGC